MGGKVRFVYDQDNDWLVDNQSGDVLCQFWNKFEVPFKDHIYWGSVVAAALNNLDKNGHFVQQTSGGAKPKLPKR